MTLHLRAFRFAWLPTRGFLMLLALAALPSFGSAQSVPNVFGPMDLGAYEIQSSKVPSCVNADTIFCDGFDGQ